MIYARDQFVQLPVKDIYDSQIMMASINAAKDMYEKGVEQIKDFNKQYGDFFSPIQSDMDWYNKNVIGAARDQLNDLYNSGIDPARSAEGRAIISRFINQVPYGKINQMKQSAAVANEYIKTRGELQSKGLWNPEYEKFLLNGKTLEDWNTSNDGMWTRYSPGMYTDLNTTTAKWFDQLEPSYIETKNGYDWYGVRDSDLYKTMSSQMPDFINSDLGRYNYELARQQLVNAGIQNPDRNQIVSQLSQNIASANSEKLNKIPKVNQYSQMQTEHNYRLAEQKNQYDLQDRNNARQHQRDMAEISLKSQGAGSGKSASGGNIPYSQRTEITMQDNNAAAYSDINSVINSTINYWNNAKTKDAKAHADWWKNVNKELNSSKNKAEVLIKHGLIDKKGNITNRTINAYNYSTSSNTPGKKLDTGAYSIMNRSNQSYEKFHVRLADGSDRNTNLHIFTQGNAPTTITFDNGYKMSDKRRRINLQSGNYQFAPVRKLGTTSNRSYTHNSLSSKFDRWLKNDKQITAINGTDASGIELYRVPGRRGTSFDFQGYIEIPAEDLQRFSDQTGNSIQHLVNTLGLKKTSENVVSNNSLNEKQKAKDFYYVPVIRTDEASVSFIEGIDNLNNTYRYGKPNAYKEAGNTLNIAGGEVR